DAILGTGNTLVATVSASLYTVTFTGNLANTNVQLLAATSSLTGTTPRVTTYVRGDGAGNEGETLALGGAAGDTVTLSYNGVPAGAPLTAPFATLDAPTLQANLETIPLLTGNVFVFGLVGGPFNVVFRSGLGGVNVAPLTAALTGTATAAIATQIDGGFGNEVQTYTTPGAGT